jgi:hypothetical protein
MLTIKLFNTLDDAMSYRYENGTGGWIFVPDNKPETNDYRDLAQVILFSPDFTPSAIFRHAMTRGQSGKLISQ